MIGLLLFGAPKADAAGSNAVILETSMGRIVIMLYPREAPITVKNFIRYVDAGFYDGTLFHRVVTTEDFNLSGSNMRKEIPYDIIQGGGYELGMRQKRPLFPPIVNESAKGLLNKRGTIAMARTAHPDSATCQFFINVEDNKFFNYRVREDKREKDTYQTDYGYCAFGKVIRGMDVVDKISEVRTDSMGPHKNVPVKPIYIKKAYRPQ